MKFFQQFDKLPRNIKHKCGRKFCHARRRDLAFLGDITEEKQIHHQETISLVTVCVVNHQEGGKYVNGFQNQFFHVCDLKGAFLHPRWSSTRSWVELNGHFGVRFSSTVFDCHFGV